MINAGIKNEFYDKMERDRAYFHRGTLIKYVVKVIIRIINVH
jgi:hypothetical protein